MSAVPLGQVNNHMMKSHCAQCNNSVVDWETPTWFQLYHIMNVPYSECTMFGMSAVPLGQVNNHMNYCAQCNNSVIVDQKAPLFWMYYIFWMYHVAENVQERKLLRIGGKYDFRGENFCGCSLCCQWMPHTPPIFAEKTFANSHKPQNLQKFSPSKIFCHTVYCTTVQ